MKTSGSILPARDRASDPISTSSVALPTKLNSRCIIIIIIIAMAFRWKQIKKSNFPLQMSASTCLCCIGHGEKQNGERLNDNGNAMLREKTLPGGQSNNRALTVWPLLPLLIDCGAAVRCGKGIFFYFLMKILVPSVHVHVHVCVCFFLR